MVDSEAAAIKWIYYNSNSQEEASPNHEIEIQKQLPGTAGGLLFAVWLLTVS